MDLTGYVYLCSAGETFDQISMELWGDEKYAARLMGANPEYATKQMFRGGEELYVPVVEEAEMDDFEVNPSPVTAPWR